MSLSEIADGILCRSHNKVNQYFVGNYGGDWALVDTGLAGDFEDIRNAAVQRFGEKAPSAIYLTHGHMDHVGSALACAAYWNVPIYVHRLEMPFVNGKSDYPPSDPTVGGPVALASRFLPTAQGTDLEQWVTPLPEMGEPLPGLDGWAYIETPGHSPGHVSFWNATDRVLLTGDALATMDMDSVTALATGKTAISRPPEPFTCDWQAARSSMRKMAALNPFTIAPGHGKPMSGVCVAADLSDFAEDFSIPHKGRYVTEAARTDENGITFLPPAAADNLPRMAWTGLIVGTLLGTAAIYARQARKAT